MRPCRGGAEEKYCRIENEALLGGKKRERTAWSKPGMISGKGRVSGYVGRGHELPANKHILWRSSMCRLQPSFFQTPNIYT
jgi:hypothetical protein